jgi:glucuronoarabinoxylan endo-1,4-beta-xylanase
VKTAIVVLFAACLPAFAGVVVTENVSPGATSWPGSPIISTVTNPAVQAVTPESFNSIGGCTNYAETFTMTTAATLQTIDIDAGGGSGTGTGTNLILHLFDLGSQTAPAPSPYTPGTDLFNSGNGLSITYTPQITGVLEFDFTGGDRVALQSGHMYAFEIDGVINTSPLAWQRATNDTYSGGAAYRNQSWINANNARDFAMAVYASLPSSGTNSGQCTVNWNDVHQRIDGFGGGVVFLNAGLDPMTTANMNTLYGTNAGQLGLTLLRIRIDPTTNWSFALQDAQKAVAHGAGVLATPWTPPAILKDNDALTNGGSVIPTNYAAYASYLRSFWNYTSTNGAPLRAISIQNEPDFQATYESCLWSSSQFLAFFQTNLGAFTGMNIVMPESDVFNQSISDPTLNDPSAVTNVSIVAGHLYGNGNAGATIVDYPNAHNNGKPTWMTEFLVDDQTIGTAITTAKQIHDCLTTANMSAYIWWKCIGDANGLLNAAGVAQYRGFVMAQFSRFVRPGYYRIGVTSDITPVTAYQDTNSGSFAIVAINTNTNNWVSETFTLTNFMAATVTPWITAASQTLASQTVVTVSNGEFSYMLPPLSVVTFFGQVATNAPPIFTPVANQTINAGFMLAITNTATDQPPQTLKFTLALAPTNAALVQLDNNHAVFSWRPLVSQAGTTNVVQVQVADNGLPPLNATNSFTITVNPLVSLVLSAISVSATQALLTATGTVGPDYTLWGSTDLMNWQLLQSSHSPPIPVTFSDTNVVSYPDRFYRIQVGP